jgi:hypothetical protein
VPGALQNITKVMHDNDLENWLSQWEFVELFRWLLAE